MGRAENDEAKSVRAIAQAGFEAGYLATANITWADTERGRGPTGTCIRTRETVVTKQIATDPKMIPWRAEALKRGYASSVSIPLIVDSETFGAIMIYAAEPDAFDAEEVALLTELASDLAFGIGTLRTRAERDQGESLCATKKSMCGFFWTPPPRRSAAWILRETAPGPIRHPRRCSVIPCQRVAQHEFSQPRPPQPAGRDAYASGRMPGISSLA